MMTDPATATSAATTITRSARTDFEDIDTSIITEEELSECDREQLHHIGHIQGKSGNVIYFQYPGDRIVAVDANIEKEVSFFRSRSKDTKIVGSLLSNWIPFLLCEELDETIDGMKESMSQRAFYFHRHNRDSGNRTSESYALSISSVDHDYSIIGIEIELVDEQETAENFFNTVTNLGRVMESYAHETIVGTACDTVFKLLGKYDRGMVYRFNDDLSGEIIHEIKKDSIHTSYLGMRFPSSDIPLPARQLYIKNGLRYIHDVDTEAVPIVCKEGQEIDLTQCRMRAVARPHILYLRNMGVRCSLSLALVVDNELWGLLAFHGYHKPWKPSLHQRIACETITSMLSVRIEALVKKDQSARVIQLGNCMLNLKQQQSVIHNLYEWGEGLLGILDADVLVGHVIDSRDQDEGDEIVLGDISLVPSTEFWTAMANHPNRELCVLSTRKDIQTKGFTKQQCPASGFVFFREGRTQIMIGRKDRSKDVMWAGNPDQPKLRIGGKLCPRNSFDLFMEKAHTESRSWSAQDCSVISVFRDRICEHSHNWMVRMLQNDIQDANQKYMAAIDRARDNHEFFAHMSHELRTPFHGVMGCLSILHDSFETMDKEEVLDLIKTAISSGNHMMNLLNDILDISKNKHLSHECAKNKVIFQNLAQESIDGMKSMAHSRGVALKTSIHPNDVKNVIITDRTKVIQIVSNTVNNAVKFTGDGGINVRFVLSATVQDAVQLYLEEARPHQGHVFIRKAGETVADIRTVIQQTSTLENLPNSRWIYFSVRDTGCGMKSSEIADMFAPYTQANMASNRNFQGTGLGLFICMSLAQQLGGFIACSSTPNVGTTFSMGIPVELPDPNDEDASDSRSVTPVMDLNDIPMKGPIMIVDDNKVNVKVLKRSLEMHFKVSKLNFEIITANGGFEAIDLYQRRRPSLCIIDYHMPECDGIQVTRLIRNYEKENELPPSHIISYTADATDNAQTKIYEVGTDEIMSKPPPKGFIESLANRLRKVATTTPLNDDWKLRQSEQQQHPMS